MIRDTSAQDAAIDPAPAQRRRRKLILGGVAAAALGVAAVSPALSRWTAADLSVDGSQLRYATVARGRFVSDVAVQGQVVAAVSPTLYASTAGTVSTSVNAGDKVSKGEALRRSTPGTSTVSSAGGRRLSRRPPTSGSASDARRERRQPADRRPRWSR
jgi:HlyD family secretion protein